MSVLTGTVMTNDGPDGEGCWVDSESSQHQVATYQQLLSVFCNMIPFPEYINPVRAGLISTYLQQSVCQPSCRYYSTRVIVPMYFSPPLMIPVGAKTVELELYESLPGMILLTVFCNMSLTYEDSMVIYRSAASKFRYLCRKRVKLWDISAVPAID